MTSNLVQKSSLMATITFVAFLYLGCSDFFHPVKSTPTPTEYEYNYWLLQKTYLFEEELTTLSPEGDSVENLYYPKSGLKDWYTRYVPPSNSESASISMNTSIVQGDVGMEYLLDTSSATLSITANHPLFVGRVYAESPAGRAGIPRYGNIVSANGVDLVLSSQDPSGFSVKSVYDSVINYSKEISLVIAKYSSLTADSVNVDTFNLIKEDVYAPTIFLDTVKGIEVITIDGFKQTTVNRTAGTYGELKAHLDSTKGENNVRVLNLLNNPGGHVSQCVSMADLFVSEGPLSTQFWRTFDGSGNAVSLSRTTSAKPGDAGEGHKFVLLVNGRSASCSEIFTAAVAEGADIPVVGTRTYGKGIGQTTWNTIDKGMAIITNLKFLTPKGNTYHGKGIEPDYVCANGATIDCGVETAKQIYEIKGGSKKTASRLYEFITLKRRSIDLGGAFIEDEQHIGEKGAL